MDVVQALVGRYPFSDANPIPTGCDGFHARVRAQGFRSMHLADLSMCEVYASWVARLRRLVEVNPSLVLFRYAMARWVSHAIPIHKWDVLTYVSTCLNRHLAQQNRDEWRSIQAEQSHIARSAGAIRMVSGISASRGGRFQPPRRIDVASESIASMAPQSSSRTHLHFNAPRRIDAVAPQSTSMARQSITSMARQSMGSSSMNPRSMSYAARRGSWIFDGDEVEEKDGDDTV
jgi:hypothetical protein